MSEWFEPVSSLPLQQGDFVRDLNIYVQDSPEESEDPDGQILAPLDKIPLSVIISQSCDLEPQPGEEYALLCHVRTMAEISRAVGKSKAAGIWENAKKNRSFHYFALPECSVPTWGMPVSVVDFRRIFEVKIERLQELCVARAPWLRLCSPYREQMAQEFARKVMRVALLADERPAWDDISASMPGMDTSVMAGETLP